MSCDQASAGECVDVTQVPSGSSYSCQGVESSSACPDASRVGSCALTAGGLSAIARFYSPQFTTASAQSECATVNGAFTPG